MFSGASVVVQGGSFVASPGSPSSMSSSVLFEVQMHLPRAARAEGGLDKLFAEVAPNAILNAGGRADEVRCFPGTRREVIGKLEEFMDGNSPDRKRMMWLSGPAGAGKSAIFQTVAERRNEQGRQAANYFFFRDDSTRSHSKPLVATLVYQLRRFYPALNEHLSDFLESDPLIFSASIEAQFKQLLSLPIKAVQSGRLIQQQIPIIIDGLDECSNETRDQDQILAALHTLAHADSSPFLILISSRAEPQLVMSFNRLGGSVESIFLNDDYQPQKDIRHFVVGKFAEIKKDHHLARTLIEEWPPDAHIDAIIDKSSGQFLYAATVMRFIQFSSSSPVLSLLTILEMSPSTDHNPLAHLDAVYSHIFSQVHNIEEVKLILFARYCMASCGLSQYFVDALRLVGYDDIRVESYFADLVAIIKVVPGQYDPLRFYHESLEDYLTNRSQSTIYYVNENEIAAGFSSMCLKNIRDADSIRIAVIPLSYVQNPTPELSRSLLEASTKYLNGETEVLFLDDLISEIERLYWEHDKDQFKLLLQHWIRFAYINNLDKISRRGIKARNPSASPYFNQYWWTERHAGQKPLKIPDSASAGVAKSNIQETSTTVSPNASIGDSVGDLSIHKFGVPRGNHRFNDDKRETRTAQRRGTVAGPAEPFASTIRVKFYYQDDIRSMALTPDTPFSEFVNKITAKFCKNLDDLTMKFKDEHGDKITIRDDSDYEHAIQTAQQSIEGKAKGLLEIWCQDSV